MANRPYTGYTRALRPNRPRGLLWRFLPYILYGLVGLVSIAVLAYLIDYLSPNHLLSYLVAVNVVAFCMYAFDKLAAQADWLRVPEIVLVLLVCAFGFFGAELARNRLRHKTLDVQFRVKYWLAVLLSIVLFLLVLLRGDEILRFLHLTQ